MVWCARCRPLSRPSLVAVVGGGTGTREPISPEIVLYSPVGEGGRSCGQKRTILPEDIIYAGKGRVATALVAKWGPTLSYIPGPRGLRLLACIYTHRW